MRIAAIALLLVGPAASAQSLASPAQAARLARYFDVLPGERTLRCEVRQLRPTLNFGFRFQAGYFVTVPLEQYEGRGHSWGIVARITAEGAKQPSYLTGRTRLPEIPKTAVDAEVGGGYLLGEGRYHVEWMMIDDSNRYCRKSWNVGVKLAHGERKVKVAMPPGTVADLSGRGLSAARAAPDDAAPFRLTVLLHAAPLSPRRTTLHMNDRLLLVGSLATLLERVPATAVRVVAFNLDQQTEIFRQDNFRRESINRLLQSVNTLELGKVDIHVLENAQGHVDILRDLVNREMAAAPPSDAVVFLGPPSRFLDKVQPASMAAPQGLAPRFFYFQYRPFFGRDSSLPDSIGKAVASLKGKTLFIQSPADLANAIDQLERRAAAAN